MRPLFKKIINVRITGRLNHYECFRHSLGWCMSYSAFLARLFSEVFTYPPLPHIEYFSICWCRSPVDRYSQWADWTIKKSYSRNSISFSFFDMINNSKTNFLWLWKRILLEKENNITWTTHCRGSFMNTLKTNAKHELSLSKE